MEFTIIFIVLAFLIGTISFAIPSKSSRKISDDYNEIQNGLQNLSPFVVEIIFSDSSISFIWKENEGLDELIKINNLLKIF